MSEKEESSLDILKRAMKIARERKDIYAMLLIADKMREYKKEREEHPLLFEP